MNALIKNNFFSCNRTFWLIKREIAINLQSMLFFTLTVSLLLLIVGLFNSGSATNFHPSLYGFLLVGGGFWLLQKNVAPDLHSPQQQSTFLTLPASSLEKFLTKFILTSVGYITALTLIFYLSSCLVSLAQLAIYGINTPLFNPFAPEILHAWHYYIILHAVFFLGTLYFKKHALSKTILTTLLISITVIAFTRFTFRLFFYNAPVFMDGPFLATYGNWLLFLATVLLLPICWLLAYIRFLELEVN